MTLIYRYQARAPFVIYADFETINLPADDQAAHGPKSHKSQKQVPCAVGYKVVPHRDIMINFEYKHAIGRDCHKWFIKEMLDREEELMAYLTRDLSLNMNYQDRDSFDKATECYLCHKPYDLEKDDKVKYLLISIQSTFLKYDYILYHHF